jgi:hypothetical protein
MIVQALQQVFKNGRHIVSAFTISILVFIIATLLPNLILIKTVFSSSGILFSDKISLLVSLIGSIQTNFTVFSATYTILIAVLFGIYISMLIYFIKNRVRDISQGGVATGTLGIISGMLGVGCAACGAFLLTSLLSTFGIAGIISYLPFDGGEFGIIGVVLLVVSIYLTAKKIMSPQVCIIKN